MMQPFFDSVPRELEEAAWIDGCGVWEAFRRVTLPLSAPGLAATAVICFILSWNDFFYALVLTRTNASTAPVAIVNFIQYTGWEWGRIAAAGTLVMLPVVDLLDPGAQLSGARPRGRRRQGIARSEAGHGARVLRTRPSTTTSWSAAARPAARSPARLSESGRFRVLLLEAGEDDRWIWLRVPLGAGRVLLSERSLWRFYTEPEPHSATAGCSGRAAGCSAAPLPSTACCGCAASPREYDHWRDARQPRLGIRRRAALPQALEAYAQGDPARAASRVRSTSSSSAAIRWATRSTAPASRPACRRPPTTTAPNTRASAILQSNTKRGLRFGGREAYLRSGARPTKPARAHRRARPPHPRREGPRRRRGLPRRRRAPFRPRHARGDRQRRRGAEPATTRALRHRRQGAAGADFGIASVAHLPGVGENCRDHLHTRVSFECTRPITLNDILDNPLRKAWMGLRYLVRRDGEMAACTATVHALAKTDPSLDRPDVKIQMHNLSAEDPRHPTELVLDKFPGFGIGTFALAAGIERLGAHPLGRSRRAAHDRGQLPRRPARPQPPASPRCGWHAASPRSRRCKADRPRGAAGAGGAVRRGAARAHRQARAPPPTTRSAPARWAAMRWRWSTAS